MSRNGSGTYNLPAGNPVVTGTTITTTWANTTLNDIASSLTGSVASDGQTPMTGALNMGNNKVIAVTDPTSAQDAATKAYVDLTQTAANISGGVITGAALTNDTIDNSPIGNTTRSSVKATTLDLGLATQSVAIGQGNASIMKNRIINGAMVINQRAIAAQVPLAAGVYLADRWTYNSNQSTRYNAVASTTTPPIGFTTYLGFVSQGAFTPAAGDWQSEEQVIEGFNISDLGWGTANAKIVTLSFWVQSSLTGTHSGALVNGATDRSYPFNYTISSANTWTQISVTIAGDTTGTWATNNTAGLRVRFNLGTGSTYLGTAGSWASAQYFGATGSINVSGTTNATFQVTGVQLEVGSSATGFEYRQYQQELALCQRYFWKLGIGYPYLNLGVFVWSGPSGADCVKTPPVTMRAIPTLTLAGAFGASYGSFSSVAIDANQSTPASLDLSASGSSGTNGYSTFYRGNNDANCSASFNSEL